MEKKSNVTVIIPCFNDGLYVKEALLSIQNQSLKADKVIVVDDGSDTATKEVLNTITFPNLEIIFQENQGVSVARNNAIHKATTPYILNLDADDILAPTFIEKAVAILNSNETIGAVGSYCQLFDTKNSCIDILRPIGGTIQDFLIKNNVSANSMFRKVCWEQVNGFDANMRKGYEDWEFWIAITSNNWKVNVLDEILMYYRIKENSRDKKALKNYDLELRTYIFQKHKSIYLQHFDYSFTALLQRNATLKQAVQKNEASIEFRIGQLVLAPFRFLKKII